MRTPGALPAIFLSSTEVGESDGDSVGNDSRQFRCHFVNGDSHRSGLLRFSSPRTTRISIEETRGVFRRETKVRILAFHDNPEVVVTGLCCPNFDFMNNFLAAIDLLNRAEENLS